MANYINKVRLKFSTMPSSEKISNKDIQELLEEYPVPKQIIYNVISEAFLRTEDRNIKPVMNVEQISFGNSTHQPTWHATLTMNWPENFQVEGLSPKKAEAERIAYLLACQKLKELGHLNSHNEPIFPKQRNEKDLQVAKTTLYNIFNRLWRKLGNQTILPIFKTNKEAGLFTSKNVWKTKLFLKYPESKTFEAISGKLSEAEQKASMKALAWLLEEGVINPKHQLLSYSRFEEQQMFDIQNMPCPLHIPDYLQDEINSTLNNYKALKQNHKNLFSENLSDENEENSGNITQFIPINILNEKPYSALNEHEASIRNLELHHRLELLKHTMDSELQNIQKDRLNLPIAQKRESIVNLIHNNQVVVLSGETGCGKTTQVPQYILDSFISDMKGSDCNIVITQPRRISAITIAERVAAERGEPIGQTIGYQVRLNKVSPSHGHGALLFCSTGMLLRKLCFNPNLDGISHVIIDEVHERSMQIDFLLILLKELLEKNEKIKLIIMSASFNTSIFSEYFNGCPIIHVPGKIYPVREYFLEDFSRKINFKEVLPTRPKLNVKLLTNIIQHADKVEKPGAILCFLPGWNEISAVFNELETNNEMFKDDTKYTICKLHSKLSPEEQKKVFLRPPNGVRKIVLTTNVAECSITINDVVCVVDSGFHKGTSFDNYSGNSSLGVHWITKANVRQRRGRAGRIQPGTCYYAFPRSIFFDMSDYPTPEMQRMSLEKVVLDCKLYCPDVKAQEFLSSALQPPSKLSIQMGVQELTVMGILNPKENLTTLGDSIVHFATHPRISKALVTATFLKCIDPVLTIAAFLTFSQDPFCDTLDKSCENRKIKQNYDQSKFSDHLSLYNLFCKWNSIDDSNDSTEKSNFLIDNLLDEDSMVTIKKLKGLFAENLFEAGFINSIDDAFDLTSMPNQNSKNTEIILSALASGFYPNVIKIQQGEIHRGYLNKDTVTYSTLNDQVAILQQDSVAFKEYNLPSSWLIYFSTLKSEARMALLMPRVSCIPGICLLLFSGQELILKTKSEPDSNSENKVSLLVDDYKKLSFSCSEKESQIILDWHQNVHEIFQTYLRVLKQRDSESQVILCEFIDCELLPILKEILKLPQIPFTQGKKYKISEGEITSEDL